MALTLIPNLYFLISHPYSLFPNPYSLLSNPYSIIHNHSIPNPYSLIPNLEMQVTTELLECWFGELNRKYFGGELPLPRLEVGNSRTLLGTMRCRTRRKGLLSWKKDYSIRISNYYDVSEDEFRNVLLHEMIHYYIAVKGLKDTSPHGTIFRRIMDSVNASGWHVSVRERRRMPIAEHNMRRSKPHIVLSMTTNKGETLLTVVSNTAIMSLERQLRRLPTVERWEWRSSTDATFNSWPRVRTLRARRVSSAECDRLIGLTQPMKI